MFRKIFFGVGIVSVSLIVSAADKINLKIGLWETTTSTDIAGSQMPAMPAIPPDVLAKMPPEQRARIQSMMTSRAPGGGMTSRSCITQKDLERGLKPEADKEQSCKVDSTKTTGTSQEMHMTCTGPHGTSTGVFAMTATSRESFDGTLDMNIKVQERPMAVKMKMKGKWLGADCGDVKPRED